MAFSLAWDELLSRAADAVAAGGAHFFRGQEHKDWGLVPAIGRSPRNGEAELQQREARLFADFQIRAGNLLADDDAWRIAFLMQHHGLPTRLLDWSASFAIALHFALRHARDGDAVVWILAAERLNHAVGYEEGLLLHGELQGDYRDFFITRKQQFPYPVVGLAPSRSSPRLQQQRGFFTLHRDLTESLEQMHPEVVQKIEIPAALFGDARAFLRLSGVNEFALFPDLDGLARYLRTTHELP